MKIGIITLPLHTNYGGILQAYALQRVLQDMGHNVVLLDSYPKCPQIRPFPIQLMVYVKRLLMKIIAPHKAIPLFYEKEAIVRYSKKEHIRQFYRQNVNHVSFGPQIKLNPNDFDVLIAGSDQVWRPMYNPNIYNGYLAFAKKWPNVRRIAYAVSFGTDKWEYNDKQTSKCRQLVKLFDAISVREESAVALCKDNLDINASWVLDPTLLVNPQHYIKHVSNTAADYPSSMCFGYILDASEEKDAILHRISKALDYNLVVFKNIDDLDNSSVPSVEEWLRAFMDAEMVFTDSFHGCIFSIIFNKPFWVIGNKKRGNARFDSLLKQFGLENRRISIDEIETADFTTPIDWEKVNSIKKEWQEKSINFLKENL